jgi:hypothetical protein
MENKDDELDEDEGFYDMTLEDLMRYEESVLKVIREEGKQREQQRIFEQKERTLAIITKTKGRFEKLFDYFFNKEDE